VKKFLIGTEKAGVLENVRKIMETDDRRREAIVDPNQANQQHPFI